MNFSLDNRDSDDIQVGPVRPPTTEDPIDQPLENIHNDGARHVSHPADERENSVRNEITESAPQTETGPSIDQLITDNPATTVSNTSLNRGAKSKRRAARIRFNIDPRLFEKDEQEQDASPALLILPMSETIHRGALEFTIDVEAFNDLPVRARGEYGAVYRYHIQSSDMNIAVKRVDRRAVQEVETLNTVAVAEISSIVEYYCTLTKPGDDCMWICMEYMDASLLEFYRVMHQLYQADGMPRKQLDRLLFRILRSCADGLCHLKNRGYAHRDIKPANILINWHGMVKICDFGISVDLEKLRSGNTSEKGTEIYMPCKRACDIQDDMWALGITLLEIANGNNPFLPDQNNRQCSKLCFKPPIPDTLCELMGGHIRHLLQEEPSHRPASYWDILEWDGVCTVPDLPTGEEIQFVERILFTLDRSSSMLS